LIYKTTTNIFVRFICCCFSRKQKEEKTNASAKRPRSSKQQLSVKWNEQQKLLKGDRVCKTLLFSSFE
jgi:hypothetical protein